MTERCVRLSLAAALLWLATGLAAAPAAAGTLAGDVEKGRETYFQCLACHSIDANRVGPMHRGLFGRTAGSVPGFAYSDAMRRAGERGLVWNDATLDAYLAAPARLVPGNRMLFGGIADAETRADLIAYLREATALPDKNGKAAK